LMGELPTEQKSGDLITIEHELTLNLLSGDYFVSLGIAQDHESKDAIPVDRRYDMIHLHISETQDSFGSAALNGRMRLVTDNDQLETTLGGAL